MSHGQAHVLHTLLFVTCTLSQDPPFKPQCYDLTACQCPCVQRISCSASTLTGCVCRHTDLVSWRDPCGFVAAGRLSNTQTGVASSLSVLAMLYGLWHVSKAWPGVAAAGGHSFSMQQVRLPCFEVSSVLPALSPQNILQPPSPPQNILHTPHPPPKHFAPHWLVVCNSAPCLCNPPWPARPQHTCLMFCFPCLGRMTVAREACSCLFASSRHVHASRMHTMGYRWWAGWVSWGCPSLRCCQAMVQSTCPTPIWRSSYALSSALKLLLWRPSMLRWGP